MADLVFTASSSLISLVAATPKTLLQLKAPANQRVKILGWGVYFNGQNADAQHVVVRLLRQTDDGTMSGAAAEKVDASIAETVQTVARENASVEPAAGSILCRKQIHPKNGYEENPPDPGKEYKIPAGGRLAIEVNAPAAVDAVAWFRAEE